jgi:hypothetical protein
MDLHDPSTHSLILDFDSHAAGRASDDPAGVFDVAGVEVVELGFGDLADLF